MSNLTKFKTRRKELGLTLKEIADMVGVNYTTILRWENGEISNMRIDKAVLYAKALHVTPTWILGVKDPVVAKSIDFLKEERANLLIHINEIIKQYNIDDLTTILSLTELTRGLTSEDIEKIIDYISFIKSKEDK